MGTSHVSIEFRANNPPEGIITAIPEAGCFGFQGWVGLLAELQQIINTDDGHNEKNDPDPSPDAEPTPRC